MQHAASASSWQPASQLMGSWYSHGAPPPRCCCLYLGGKKQHRKPLTSAIVLQVKITGQQLACTHDEQQRCHWCTTGSMASLWGLPGATHTKQSTKHFVRSTTRAMYKQVWWHHPCSHCCTASKQYSLLLLPQISMAPFGTALHGTRLQCQRSRLAGSSSKASKASARFTAVPAEPGAAAAAGAARWRAASNARPALRPCFPARPGSSSCAAQQAGRAGAAGAS
jgi:hypothetical protein